MNEYICGINCSRTSTLMYSFSRVRDLALIMVKSVLDEFKQSSFKIVAFEKDISDRGGDSLHPMEIKVGEGDNTPIVSLGGVVDRIDRYDGEDGRFLRVVDYKTGSHRFDVSKVANGADLQLPAYLFTAALDENKSFFGEADPLFPASAVFLSAEEKGGRINPVRSGFVLAEENFLHAVNHNNEKKMMAGAYIKKDGTITGDSALSRDGIIQMRDTLRSTIAKTAENMYSGKAPRTPSKDSCAFCPMKASCPVAHKE
jgi:ATP-dependent helicase/nuclease subunit B